MPASSKTDPPLAKAEPISSSGSTSGITYLRRGKSCCTTATAAGERNERNNSADPKVIEEGGGGGASGTGADSPAAHGEDHSEAGCAPAAHGGPHRSRDPPAACGGPTLEQVDARRRL
ncbi:unnamed protein product [Bubo scandiacus]